MSKYRTFYPDFWNDTKIVDTFTPEDKYFMLWAVTNTYVNIIGCYEVSVKQISYDLGYTKESIENLLKRFNTIHKNILYDFETKELLVVNFSKYNWTKSPKIDVAIKSNIEKVKSIKFKNYLTKNYNERETVNDSVSIPYPYSMDTTVTDTVTVNNTDNTSLNRKIIEEVINYLNEKTEKNFKSNTKNTVDFINGRLNEGYTIEDFKKVIDNKVNDWKDDPINDAYLRPSTLFRPSNFENYLNQKSIPKQPKESSSKGMSIYEQLKQYG